VHYHHGRAPSHRQHLLLPHLTSSLSGKRTAVPACSPMFCTETPNGSSPGETSRGSSKDTRGWLRLHSNNSLGVVKGAHTRGMNIHDQILRCPEGLAAVCRRPEGSNNDETPGHLLWHARGGQKGHNLDREKFRSSIRIMMKDSEKLFSEVPSAA
jgi:hypothetical protein